MSYGPEEFQRDLGQAVPRETIALLETHRRLLADHLSLLRGVTVTHHLHDGRRTPHPPTEGVRVEGDTLVYDGLLGG